MIRQSAGFRLIFFAWLLSFPSASIAQTWSLDTYFGRTSYANTFLSDTASRTAVLGIRYNRDRLQFQAAGGAPVSSDDLTWGVVGFENRFAVHRGGLVAGADAAVFAHAQRDPLAGTSGKGLLGEFLPMISHNTGKALLEFRSGLRWYGERLDSTEWSRTLWSSDVRASIEPIERLRLEGTLRHDRTRQGENYTRPGASLTAAASRLVLRGSVGGWVHNPNDSGAEWGASLALSLTPRIWFVSGAQHQSFDPTYLASPRTSWGLGMTFQLTSPQPVGSRNPDRVNRSVIRLPLRNAASTPYIAGDFTNWMPVRMSRYEHEWRYSAVLAPGVYHFAFRSEDGTWFVPETFPGRIADGMGGWNAVLVVP